MAAQPITIFSHKIDPDGVLAIIQKLAPKATVSVERDSWTEIVVLGPKRMFRKPDTIRFTHQPAYYAEPGWYRQVSGMQGYVSRFPDVERKPDVLRAIGALRFAVGTLAEPLIDLDEAGEYQSLVFAVTRHLDGIIFTPSEIRDSSGRILIGADGTGDESASLPMDLAEGRIAATVQIDRNVEREEDEGEDEPDPPSPMRVARRAMVLAALSYRGLLEQDEDGEEHRPELLAWVGELSLDDEIEADEWKILQRPVGRLDQQEVVNATWMVEGLSVLTWALGLVDSFPPADEQVDPGKPYAALGLLDAKVAKNVIKGAELRSTSELETCRSRQFAIHWRLRNYSLRPQAMDFNEFARTAWFGPLDITDLRLIENDLALGGQPISRASRQIRSSAASTALERHRAANWLSWGGLFSETDTST